GRSEISKCKSNKIPSGAVSFPYLPKCSFPLCSCPPSLQIHSQEQVKKPWASPKPTSQKFPLAPLQKTPPTPSLFEGAPSPVGRTKQSFVNAERVENQWLVSTP